MLCSIGKKTCSKKEKKCSCLSYKEVLYLVYLYNKYSISNYYSCKDCIKIIKPHSESDKIRITFYYLENLKEKICTDKNNCSEVKIGEYFNKSLKAKEILRKNFLPVGPLQFQWLSNFDINAVMQQHSSYYKSFLFTGTHMIDFNQNKLLSIYKKLVYNNFGIKYIGSIFNTDISSGIGKHWISSFVDIKNKKIYFYDSYGIAPPRPLKIFLVNLNNRIFKRTNSISYNNTRHQYGGSECGTFCLFFITSMLKNDLSFDDFCKQKFLTDSFVNKERESFFRE